jgi:hypothetical protein
MRANPFVIPVYMQRIWVDGEERYVVYTDPIKFPGLWTHLVDILTFLNYPAPTPDELPHELLTFAAFALFRILNGREE